MQVNYITQNPVAGAIAEHRRRQLEEDKILNAIAAQEADAIIKFRQAPLDLRRSQADTTSAESKARVAQGTEQADIDYATTRARNEGLQTEGIQSQNRRAAAEADYSVGSLPYRLTEAENQAIGSGYETQRAGYQAQSAGVKLSVDRATAGADIAVKQADAHLKALDLAAAGNATGAIAVMGQNGIEVTPSVQAAMQNREALARAAAALEAYRKISDDPVWLYDNVTRFMGGDVAQTGMAPGNPPPVKQTASGKTDEELWLAAMDDASKALTANYSQPTQEEIIAYATTLYRAAKNLPAAAPPQTAQSFPQPNDRHVAFLMANPAQRAAFDQKFGPGASARYLGAGR